MYNLAGGRHPHAQHLSAPPPPPPPPKKKKTPKPEILDPLPAVGSETGFFVSTCLCIKRWATSFLLHGDLLPCMGGLTQVFIGECEEQIVYDTIDNRIFTVYAIGISWLTTPVRPFESYPLYWGIRNHPHPHPHNHHHYFIKKVPSELSI